MKVFLASDIYRYDYQNRTYISSRFYKIFMRYVSSFGEIILCSRVIHSEPEEESYDVTELVAECISFEGFGQLYSSQFTKNMIASMKKCDLVIGRFEAFSACHAFECAKKAGKPFFGEVMSDPWDGLWNHGLLGKLAAPYSFFETKRALAGSRYALYVTEKFLQNRYPCKYESVGVSNVFIKEIPDALLEKRLDKIKNCDMHHVTLMTTAATYVRYKGQEYVIRAIPALNKAGIKVRYLIVGEGDQTYLRNMAKKCNVEDQVEFTGHLTLNEVLALADETDIYVQPSLQEGLPRSVIEAMSRGCPAIGARTAGIPELIREECVFKRKSPEAIVKAVLYLRDKKILQACAEENFKKSREFLDDVLTKRRNDYYSKIINELTGK